MLTEIRLENFKCFETLTLKLRPLTLLSGVNGGGKSSVIQAIMLLAHTLSQREWTDSLLLDGPELALGTAADVLNHRSSRREMRIGATAGGQQVDWQFQAENRRALTIKLRHTEIDGQVILPTAPLRCLMPPDRTESSPVVQALRRISWITAERTGPRELLPLRDPTSHRHVGNRGELAAGLLHWREQENVRESMCIEELPPTLFHQVRGRMREFFGGCDLRISPVDGASAVSLQLRCDSKSEFQRPQNVGFGLTQLFPILVAVLSAAEGDCVFVENPEVHLHPKAQQHIGWLLAHAAASGLQVVIETHSDHVLNGVRLAAKAGIVTPQNAAVYFFAPGQDGEPFTPQSPTLDADGRLSSWPEGFFDQYDAALAELL